MTQRNPDIIDAPLYDSDNEYKFIEGSYFSIQFKFFAFAIIPAGIKLVLNLNFLGLILICVGLVFIFAKKGILINFSAEKYRYLFRLFGKNWGKWQALPDIEYVSIFSAKKNQQMSHRGQSASVNYSEIEVNLCYKKNKKINVYLTNKYGLALQKAKYFSDIFKIEIYDATEREAKWL